MLTRFPAAAAAIFFFVCNTIRAEIDPQGFDRSIKPQDDFYDYVNGTWLKTATIPAENARWGAFEELRERNWQNVHAICERVAAKPAGATAIERMVGDFYASGMNEA